jgi:hypothetical protein
LYYGSMTKPVTFATALLVVACAAAPKTAPAPALRATFNVSVPEPGQPMPTPSPLGTRVRPPCLYSATFAGLVVPGQGDARILLSRAFVNVERHNDKEFDALTLRLEVAGPGHMLGAGNPVEYHLTPTVDSAGPSITTWQPHDTLRLLVPWSGAQGGRSLLLFLDYRAIAHDGTLGGCSAILKSDLLRF